MQGNLDPITLFAPLEVLELRVNEILRSAAGRPGHIFNLGHGIVPTTPVENVQAVVRMVREFTRLEATARPCLNKPSCCSLMELLKPSSRFPSTCATWSADVRCRESVVEEIQHRYSLIGRSPLTEITMEQARLVEAELAAVGPAGSRLRRHAQLASLYSRGGAPDARRWN